MTGEQKADDTRYLTIVCTSFSASALAGFVGFISGITEVTPRAGLNNENTGKVTRSSSPFCIPNSSLKTRIWALKFL